MSRNIFKAQARKEKMQKTSIALLMAMLLIVPASAFTLNEIAVGTPNYPTASEPARVAGDVSASPVPSPETPSTPTRSSGGGKYKCTTAYAYDTENKKVIIRDVIVTKRYTSRGEDAYKDMTIHGKKCKYRVNNIWEIIYDRSKTMYTDVSPIDQREVMVR